MKKVLAFDFGASFGRAILAKYNNGELTYEEVHRFENIPIEENGSVYWDFDTLYKEVLTGISLAKDFDSIGFDTWGVDYVLIDKQGELIGKPFHYRDLRTEKGMKKVFSKITEKELYQQTGNQIISFNTLFQLVETDTSKADKLLFMPDLFIYKLTGIAQCEMSIASTSQMMDLNNKTWNKEILSKFNIPEKLLLPPQASGRVVGNYKNAKVVAVAGHDTQCAIAALPTTDEDVLYLSCGTWSLLGTELNNPMLSEQSYELNLSNEIGANGKINYLKNIIGLWLAQESKRAFKKRGEVYSFAELADLALQAEPLRYIIDPDSPEFTVAGDMPSRIQEFCERTGQGKPETVGEIMRTIYDSLALKYRYVVEQIEQITGKNYPVLHIIGGGANAKILCQLTANSLNKEVIAGPSEATAIGNVLTQLVALGEIKDLNEGRKWLAKTEKTCHYSPQNTSAWQKAYAYFKECIV